MSVMASQFSPESVLDLVAHPAIRLDAAIVLQEGVALVPQNERLEDLPEDLRQDAKVVSLSGAVIQAAISHV